MKPGYWMNETSGVLRPAVEAYLRGHAMTEDQIAALRTYLRQWITRGAWAPTDGLALLRAGVDELRSRQDISEWLEIALDEGIDPL